MSLRLTPATLAGKLFGRDAELQALQSTASAALRGRGRAVLLVAGPPGAGKTALLEEARKRLTLQGALPVSGRFDACARGGPYSALAVALNALTVALQARALEGGFDRERLRAEVAAKIPEGLHQILPALTALLGTAPAPRGAGEPEVSAAAITLALEQLLAAITRQQALVLCLDDLHHADADTARLLEQLCAAPELQGLVFLLGCRSSPAGQFWNARRLADGVRNAECEVLLLELDPLTPDAVVGWLAAASAAQGAAIPAPAVLRAAASAACSNASAYPLDVIERLQDGQEAAPPASQATAARTTPSYFERSLTQLDAPLQRALGAAAILGELATPGLLATLADQTPESISRLFSALARDPLLAMEAVDSAGRSLRFSQDRLRTAAAELIPASEHALLQCAALRALRASDCENDFSVYALADCANRAGDALTDPAERDRAARWNQAAAQGAAAAAAFQRAQEYACAGLRHLDAPPAAGNRALRFDLALTGASAAARSGDTARSEALYEIAEQNAASTADALRLADRRLYSALAAGEFRKAAALARKSLAAAGLSPPRWRSRLSLEIKIGRLRFGLWLRGARRGWRASASTGQAHANTDPDANANAKAACARLVRAAGAVCLLDPLLTSDLLTAGLQRMLATGAGDCTPALLIGFAALLTARGKYRPGERYGRLAIILIKRDRDPTYRALAQLAFEATIAAWRRPLAESARRLHKTGGLCLESGAIESAAGAFALAWDYELFAGWPLDELRSRLDARGGQLDRWNAAARRRRNLRIAAVELQSGVELWPPRANLALYDPACEREFEAAGDSAGLFLTHFYRGLCEYHLGEAAAALELFQRARKAEPLIASLQHYPRLHFQLSLAASAAYRKNPRREFWRAAIDSARRLARIARAAPENCAHLAALADAELERMRGRYPQAMLASSRAAELAHAGGFLAEEALARALCAEGALAAGQPGAARLQLQEAGRLYEKLSAQALLERCQRRLPAPEQTAPPRGPVDHPGADLSALLEASRVASGAGALRELLGPGFRIILENAGAEQGALILAEGGAARGGANWRVIVCCGSEGEAILFPPRSFRDQLAPALVIERCLATAAPADYNADEDRPAFAGDAQFQRSGAASALCLPLMRQGGAHGALFLASAQSNAFQQASRDVLVSLAGQLLLAAENAALYEKQRNYEREIELEKLKSSFFASISHEFRTPLTLILAPLESLIQSARSEKDLQPLLVIRKNALALLRLVSNLLDAALAEEGRLRAELRPLDLSGLVRELTSLFQEAARARGTLIETRLPPEPLPALADPTLFERALLNLLGNAVKFTDQGRITVSASALKDAVRISVRDSGAGVSAEKQARLFQRYPLGARDARKGAGLGLYLTRLIIDLHGGALRHAAPEDGGAEFIIDLKRAPDGADLEEPELHLDRYYAEALGSDAVGPAAVAPRDLSTAFAHSSDRPRVLIVEDEPELAAALIQFFSDRYAVLHGENGIRGYELALQFGPDVVVADVLMPESSGLDMLERMRANESLRATPVLLLTARADAASRRRGLDLGAEDYVAKPFDPRELELRVRNLVERKRRAENALDRMRERMFADFHDYLGAPLTDLNHIVDRLEREGGLPPERLEELRESVRRTHWSFRNLLETSDDLRILERDFLYGLHLTLLRRYAALNREFRLSIDPDLSRSLQGAGQAGLKSTLHVTALEITTNDLKYGEGPSTWEIRTAEDDDHILELTMEAATRYAAEPGRRGRGGANIVQRAAEIGGSATLRVENDRFFAQIRLPLHASRGAQNL